MTHADSEYADGGGALPTWNAREPGPAGSARSIGGPRAGPVRQLLPPS